MTTDPRVIAQIDANLHDKDPKLRQVVNGIRRLVKEAVPGVKETLNPWHVPTFDLNGPICYFSAAKNHVTFGFYHAASLDDPKGLLEGTGKNLRHVKIHKVEDLSRDGLRDLVLAAARLNQEKSPEQQRRPHG